MEKKTRRKSVFPNTMDLEYFFDVYIRSTERGKSNQKAYKHLMLFIHKREMDLLKMEHNINI